MKSPWPNASSVEVASLTQQYPPQRKQIYHQQSTHFRTLDNPFCPTNRSQMQRQLANSQTSKRRLRKPESGEARGASWIEIGLIILRRALILGSVDNNSEQYSALLSVFCDAKSIKVEYFGFRYKRPKRREEEKRKRCQVTTR